MAMRETHVQSLEEADQITGESEQVGELNLEFDSFSTEGLRLFLNQIGDDDLLKAHQEVRLAKRVDLGLAARKRLYPDTTQEQEEDDSEEEEPTKERFPEKPLPELPKKITKAALEALIANSDLARKEFVEANLRLVVSIAKNYRDQGVPFLDLIQEGTLGLNRAVEKFDWHRGNKFSTYATRWIRQAVQRAIAKQARTIRVPTHVVERRKKIGRVTRELRAQLGREPTNAEIAAETNYSEAKVIDAPKGAEVVVSLNKPIGSDSSDEVGSLVAGDSEDDPLEQLAAIERNESLYSALMLLSERERLVLELRFGLEDGEEHSLNEIGKALDQPVSREMVRKIEAGALAKLKVLVEGRIESSNGNDHANTDPDQPDADFIQSLPNGNTIELTADESRVLTLLAQAKSHPYIARDLNIGPGAVRNLVIKVRHKIGAQDKANAEVMAKEILILAKK